MTKQEELQEYLEDFKYYVWLVFENDWEFTRAAINDPLLVPNTFLNPGVDDESNNWANRGGLLKSYRALVKTMQDLDIPADHLGQFLVKTLQKLDIPTERRAQIFAAFYPNQVMESLELVPEARRLSHELSRKEDELASANAFADYLKEEKRCRDCNGPLIP